MRVVLDTNVLLSALISPHGLSDTLYRADRSNRRIAPRQPLCEVQACSPAAPRWNDGQQPAVLDHIEPLPDSAKTDDPDDAFLLAMALAGEADYLVTGDHRAGLLQRGGIGRTRIVTPAVFCAETQ
jgi:predicted nucleic acid-binding protein